MPRKKNKDETDKKDFYWECKSAEVLADESLALVPSPEGWPDEGLSCVGLYWIMLNAMHRSPKKGFLLNPITGLPLTVGELARIARRSVKVVERILGVIMEAGLFSKSPEGIIFSRAMERDDRKRANARAKGLHGCKGGNPALKNKVNLKDNLGDNLEVNPKDNLRDNLPLRIRISTDAFNSSNGSDSKNAIELAELWVFYSTAKKNHAAREKPEDVVPLCSALLLKGVPFELLEKEIKKRLPRDGETFDPEIHRDTTEYFWQFKKRVEPKIGNSKVNLTAAVQEGQEWVQERDFNDAK